MAFFNFDSSLSQVVERLGWVLVHSLWQFALIAIVSILAARVLRRSSSALRYGVLVAAMGLMVAAAIATYFVLPVSKDTITTNQKTSDVEHSTAPAFATNSFSSDDIEVATETTQLPLETHAGERQGVSLPSPAADLTSTAPLPREENTRWADAQPLADLFRPWLTWIVGFWGLGVLICSLRPLLGWRTLRRLRRIGLSAPNDEVLAAFQRVLMRLGMRRVVNVYHSTLAKGPLVVGYLRPIVLLPVSLVTSIPMSQLEAILAHELAHVRRHDFVINLLQTLVETLFFYHPGVWWLSHHIRIEREHCCDDLVIKLFNNAPDYGRALLAVEQLQGETTTLALGAKDGSLLARIQRIVNPDANRAASKSWLVVPLNLCICSIAAILAINLTHIEGIETDRGDDELVPPVAELSDGVRVELLGVSAPPIELPSKDIREWWTGSGKLMKVAPVQTGSLRVRPEHADGRAFAVGISGCKSQPMAQVTLVKLFQNGQPIDMPKNGRSNSSTLSSKAPEFGCTIESVHGPVGDADAATVEVKFGEAPIVLVKFDSTGKRIKDAEVDAALQNSVCQQLLDGVEILRTGPHEDGFAVWTNPFSSSTDLGSVGLTLIDKSGNEQRPFGSSGNGTENIRSFKVAPADVEAIAIRLRPYTHVATFENVSLKPGKQTDVKVSIEAIGQQPLVQADANNDEKKPIDNVSTKLHGMISDVDAARNLVEISLGADDGVVAGQVLEVYELLPGSNKPSPESKGKIRVTNDIDHDFATAQINHLQPNAVLQRGDYVIGIKAAVAAIKPAEQAVVVQAGKDEEPGVVTAKPIAATAGGPDFILPDHLNVMAVGFAADSKTLVSVSWDKAPDLDATRFATRFVIRTWDVAEKRLTREVELEWDQNWNRNSASMMLSHDRTKVISILEGKQVGIWDAASGRLINRLKPPIELQEELLGTLTCTSDLSKIACGKNAPYADTLEAADAHVIVWNANTGLVLQTLTLKTGFRVQSLAFSADGTRLATVGSQKGADVWEVSSGKRLLEFRNRNFDRKHPDRPDREKVYDIVTSAGLSPDGKLLAVSDILGVKLIDVTSGKVLRQIDAPYRYRAKSPGFVFSDDGRLFSLLGGFTQENVLPIWSMETGEMIMSLPTEAYDGSFSDDGQWFAVGLSDAKEAVAVWQTGPAKLPVGQEFLKEYPKLHGLSLDMTEKQFLEIAEQQDLKPQRTPDVDHPRYEISTGDGHTLIVMFGNNGEKCSGIQRIRGDLAAVPPPVPPE